MYRFLAPGSTGCLVSGSNVMLPFDRIDWLPVSLIYVSHVQVPLTSYMINLYGALILEDTHVQGPHRCMREELELRNPFVCDGRMILPLLTVSGHDAERSRCVASYMIFPAPARHPHRNAESEDSWVPNLRPEVRGRLRIELLSSWSSGRRSNRS